MTQSEYQDRQQKIRQWFQMWLQQQDTGIRDLFTPEAVYIESWGPEYHGALQIQHWFKEWNHRGRVKSWEIQQFLHHQQQTAVFWRFHCAMNDGTEQCFDGVSLVRWTQQGQICFLQEFGCNLNRYDPYENGSEPVFRCQEALWFGS